MHSLFKMLNAPHLENGLSRILSVQVALFLALVLASVHWGTAGKVIVWAKLLWL